MLKTVNGITYYSSPNLESFPGIVHAFLGRTGGVSTGHLSSLNMGRREEDSQENLAENRRRIAGAFDINADKIFIVSQVHSDRVVILDNAGAKPAEIKRIEADAMITSLKDITIGILTADCVPILLFDNRKKIVAAVHAGWRGTASGIVRKTVDAMMERFDSSSADIVAAIGPAIGACCYEVGEEVVSAVDKKGKIAVALEGKRRIDLPKANILQLNEAGVTDVDFYGICTSCRIDLFFSHRAEKGKTGRQLSFISML